MTDEDEFRASADWMEETARRWQSRTRAIREVDWVAERAVEHWRKDDLNFYLCDNPSHAEFKKLAELKIIRDHTMDIGKWNGYVRFPKLPGVLPGCNGIYTYVPVHGGITYFQEWADGSVTYGFDTSHAYSGAAPIYDMDWMKLETESMGRSIRIAARFERYYLAADEDNAKKARVLDRMGKFLPVEVSGNLGVMLNLFTGEL
jgi:hypothetical protein